MESINVGGLQSSPAYPLQGSMGTVDVPDEVLEIIFSGVSIADAVHASLVCKRWRYLLCSSPSLPFVHANKPWLFVFGVNRPCVSARKQVAWGFDPLARRWIGLPPLRLQSGGEEVDVVEGEGVVLGILGGSRLRYCAQLLSRKWEETPPMRRCRNHPVVTFINHHSKLLLFVVGGVCREVESEEEWRGVEIYDVRAGEWRECPALPPHFKWAASSNCLSSAFVEEKGMYIWDKYAGECSCFHLDSMQWGSVVKVRRPSGVRSASLLGCGNRLILAGLSQCGLRLSFDVWSVCEASMDCRHVASMPGEMLDSFLVDEATKVECKGTGDLIYVFLHRDFAVRHRNPPVCLCDLSGKEGIAWQMLPALPSASVNPLDRTVHVCSPVTLHQIRF